jgi:hypothetical protein
VQVDGISMRLSAINSDGVAIDSDAKPLPVRATIRQAAGDDNSSGRGSLVRIQEGLAAEERYQCSGRSAEMAQTSAMIDGTPLSLFYVRDTDLGPTPFSRPLS